MSINLALQWVRVNLRHPGAASDAMDTFQKASDDGVEVTVIAASGLTTDSRCRLIRWTGSELLVLELSRAQQRGFGVGDAEMIQHWDLPSMIPKLPPRRCATLSGLTIDNAPTIDETTAITGRCTLEFDNPEELSAGLQALESTYFCPDLCRNVRRFWYPSGPIHNGQIMLPFTIDSTSDLVRICGLKPPMAIFFHWVQMVPHNDYQSIVQRLSNVAGSVVGA